MKAQIASAVCVHDDHWFLGESIRSIQSAGPCFVFASRIPWSQNPGDWERYARTAEDGYEACRRKRTLKSTQRFLGVANVMTEHVPAETFKLVGPDGKEIYELKVVHHVAWAPVRKVALATGIKSEIVVWPSIEADIDWNAENWTALVKDDPVPGPVPVKNGVSYVPIRKLASALRYEVSVEGNKIELAY